MITILAILLTNIALAVKQNPEIVPLIEQRRRHHQGCRVQLAVRPPRCGAATCGGGAATVSSPPPCDHAASRP